MNLDNKPKPWGSGSHSWSTVPVHMLSHLPTASQSRLYHSGRSKPETKDCTPRPSPSLPTTSDADLPHLTPSKTVHMTQITEKPETKRVATAACTVSFSNSRPWEILREGQTTHKGDVFSVARIAGIMAAKRTPDIVPLCHPGIGITGVEVSVELVEPGPNRDHGAMHVVASVSCFWSYRGGNGGYDSYDGCGFDGL
jgi:Molybdenum cofactor biosynthesis enzyme